MLLSTCESKRNIGWRRKIWNVESNVDQLFHLLTSRKLQVTAPRIQKSMSLFEFGGTKPLQRQSANLTVLAKCKGNIFKFEGNRESSSVEEEDCDSLSEMEMEPVDSAPEQHVVEMKEQEENLMCGTVTWRLYWKYVKEVNHYPWS